MDKLDGPAINGETFRRDPLVRALTKNAVSAHIEEFERLLDAGSREEDIQHYLASHSYFFFGVLRLDGLSPLYSKIRLGSDMETDFAWFDSGSHGPDWRLAEIEPPRHKLFTKAGDPSAPLTHAIQQVLRWDAWIHENMSYARKLMPNIEYPLGYVFIGRARDLTDANRKALRTLQNQYRNKLELHTLDWFTRAAKSVLGAVGATGGEWSVPLKALTHADLAAGLPTEAKKWMEDPSIIRALERHREARLDERGKRASEF